MLRKKKFSKEQQANLWLQKMVMQTAMKAVVKKVRDDTKGGDYGREDELLDNIKETKKKNMFLL